MPCGWYRSGLEAIEGAPRRQRRNRAPSPATTTRREVVALADGLVRAIAIVCIARRALALKPVGRARLNGFLGEIEAAALSPCPIASPHSSRPRGPGSR